MAALAAALTIAAAPSPARAAAPAPSAEELAAQAADEDLIVELRVDQLILAEAMAARRVGGGVALPLGELVKALDLAIEVDDAAGTATGFVLREDRTFRLDVRRGEAWIRDERMPFDPALVQQAEDGIYVELTQLGRWFPLTLRYEPFELAVAVVPHEPLPAQTRAARQLVAEAISQGAAAGARPPRFPAVGTPFAALGDLALDPLLNVGLAPGPDGAPRPALTYAATATSDLFWTGATLTATGTQDQPLSDLRFTLARRDADGAAFGPLGAREVALGMVTDGGLAMVAGPWSGNGAVVGSFPLNQLLRFDRHTFRGRLLPGWDAQLFRNGFPVGYQAQAVEGEYRFDDVPLVIGLNEFRVVLNGPQGQRRSEVHRFNVGATLAPAGEHRYRALRGLEREGARTSVQYDVGVTPALTATVGAAELPTLGAARRFGVAGMRGYRGELFWHATAAAEAAGGAGAEPGFQAPLGTLGLQARHAALRGFESPAFPGGGALVGRSSVRLDHATPAEAPVQLLNIVTSAVDWRPQGAPLPLLSHQLSARLGGLMATNQLTLAEAFGPTSPTGTAELGSQLGTFSLRGQATYDPTAVRAVALASTGRLPAEVRYNATTTYQLASARTTYALDLNRPVGGYVAGVTGSWSPPDAFTVGSTLSFGLVLPWETGRPEVRNQGLSAGGNAVVRAYLDADRDGKPDPGEPAIADAVLDLGGDFQVQTDATGRAMLVALPAFQPVDLDFRAIALDDPLWRPARPGARFVPRPGRTTVIDLPVVATGEVYGTVTLRRLAAVREIGGVRIEAVDAKGQVAASALSALDGYYSLTGLAPGAYTLRVDPAQAAKLRVVAPPPHAVAIPGEGAVVDGQDFEVEAPRDHE